MLCGKLICRDSKATEGTEKDVISNELFCIYDTYFFLNLLFYRVQVIGTYRCLPSKQAGFSSCTFRTIIICNNIKTMNTDDNPTLSASDISKIKRFSQVRWLSLLDPFDLKSVFRSVLRLRQKYSKNYIWPAKNFTIAVVTHRMFDLAVPIEIV